ncbi:MAG: MYXO-CTERM sorting domain-containing protein [Phycisphaerales bacterium]
MNKSIAIAAIASAALAGAAQADLVAYWNFNSLTTAINNGTTYAASSGNGSIALTVPANDNAGTNQGIAAFAGSTINVLNGDAGGQALAIQGGATDPSSDPVTNNGSTLVMSFSMTGLVDPILSYATRGTSTGFDNVQLAWSTDGVNYTNFGAAYSGRPTSFFLVTYDLSSIDALDGVASAYLRLTFNGATSVAGNNRLDNFQINATTPTPGAAALLGLGALAAGRRRR